MNDTPQENVIYMGDVLAMVPQTDALNGDVLGRLITTWSHVPASDIARMNTFQLARELMVTLPDDEGFGNELRLQVAEQLSDLLQRFGITPSQPTETVTTVRLERNYDEMSLRQLLETIVADPNTYPAAIRYIRSHRDLQPAASKTRKWVVPADDGDGVDLEATLRYVALLNKPHSVAQRIVDGRRPVTLDRAMGVNDQPLIHPITGRLVQGPDSNGFNWSDLDPEVIESVIWARRTGHSLLPNLEQDVFGYSEQLFGDPLPKRFQNILDDYREAKRERVSTVDGIRADWPEDLPHDGVFTFFSAARSQDYEALVRAAAKNLSPLRRDGMSMSIKGGIYTTIHVSGMSYKVKDVVVLEGGSLDGMSGSGTIYMPPGRSVDVSGMSSNVRVVNLSWKEIAERMGLV